jgi:hypothetical protein
VPAERDAGGEPLRDLVLALREEDGRQQVDQERDVLGRARVDGVHVDAGQTVEKRVSVFDDPRAIVRSRNGQVRGVAGDVVPRLEAPVLMRSLKPTHIVASC